MNNPQSLTFKNYNAIAWGLLSILWGVTILFDFVPFGAGLIGTGLILLGANVFLSFNGLPAKGGNKTFSILALVWGGLELGRPILHSIFVSADLDWVIFGMLLVTLGLILIGSRLFRKSEP